MPNHVTSICTVTGPAAAVAGFAEKHIVPRDDEKGRFFDFATVIPKPAVVSDTTSGSKAEVGLYALTGHRKPRRFFFELGPSDNPSTIWPYLPPTVTTRSELLAHLKANDPEALEQGKKAAACLKETGHVDWYDWSIANWGTKWGAYDYEERERADGRFVFKFETAWSFPETIFRKLAEMWPALTLAIVAFDEGGNFGCDGEFNGKNDYRCDRELGSDDALYERVYGHAPERDEEDEASESESPDAKEQP